ncbi:MAG: hypothetical protein OEZ14_13120, partial [Acidimicrobiia bacterium]|nr:hypothetical protein [Acidimicrobiia bacterium]
MADHDHSPLPPSADVTVERVEIRKLRLPVLESLDAAHGRTTGPDRELTVVALYGANGETGWGECAALATSGYWHETASSVFETLAGLIGDLAGRTPADLTDPTIVPGLDPDHRPMAAAALEMAALDLAGKTDGYPLSEWLGSSRTSVPAGAAVGLGPADTVAERVIGLAGEGYRRVKVKIEPVTATTVVSAVADRLADLFGVDAAGRLRGFELHVDANGAYPGGSSGESVDAPALEELVGLARRGVQAIEQPFAVDDEVAAAALRSALIDANLPTLVMADEAAHSVASARAVFAAGAVDGVVIKPSRLGGLVAAHRAIRSLAADGAAVAVGGMVESAL